MCKDWVHYLGKRNLHRMEIQSIDALSTRRGLVSMFFISKILCSRRGFIEHEMLPVSSFKIIK